jgi:hypothetical protein
MMKPTSKSWEIINGSAAEIWLFDGAWTGIGSCAGEGDFGEAVGGDPPALMGAAIGNSLKAMGATTGDAIGAKSGELIGVWVGGAAGAWLGAGNGAVGLDTGGSAGDTIGCGGSTGDIIGCEVGEPTG